MKERHAHLVTRLYPRSWRDRYGDEFEALLVAETGSLRTLVDVVSSAVKEHIAGTRPSEEGQLLATFALMVKKPSAVVPVAMSLAALATVLAQIALAGVARQTDEGAAAHIWQLLIAGQMPVLLFFAIRWLPRRPKQALCVLAVQAAGIVASVIPVFLLRW